VTTAHETTDIPLKSAKSPALRQLFTSKSGSSTNS
jgi:hypothetical protein